MKTVQDKVIVKPDVEEFWTKSTSMYRDADGNKIINELVSGIVVSVGPGWWRECGYEPVGVSEGQRVYFGAHTPELHKYKGQTYAILSGYDVIVVEDVGERP